MKRLLLLMAVAGLAGGLLVHELAREGGYVLVSLYGYSLETSVWFALLALLVTGLSLWLVIRLLTGLLQGLTGATRLLVHGSDERNRRLLAEGLVDFMEGNWKQARKRLVKTADRSLLPVINYLAAARSAFELGEREEARQLLARAEQLGPQHRLATALAQARMEFMDQRFEECLSTLNRVRKDAPQHPVVLDLQRQCYVALEDWNALQELLPLLKKHRPQDKLAQEITALELRCLQHRLNQAAQQSEPQAALEKAWAGFDSKSQRLPELLLHYAGKLVVAGAEARAEALLRASLDKHWDDRLLDLYGRLAGADLARQLLTAEAWLKERPRNASLLLALGRLALRNRLWGKAREYFEASLRVLPMPETYAELARLTAALGEHQLSTGYYQQGLGLITHALPELPEPGQAGAFSQTGGLSTAGTASQTGLQK